MLRFCRLDTPQRVSLLGGGGAYAGVRVDKGFYLVMHLNLLYPALSSPLFKGAESFFFLERYVEEVEQILSLPEVRTRAQRCCVA